MKKRRFYTEIAYLFGVFGIAMGVAFTTKADMGVSMIAAPAYLLHLKLSEVWSFFTFGIAEYLLQALLVLLTAILVRRFKISYLFCIVTVLLYGAVLDGCIWLLSPVPSGGMVMRVLWLTVGLLMSAFGVSFMFHTYISPEAYELFVKEVSAKWKIDISRFKTIYDCSSLLVAIVMSFAFFGLFRFVGVNIGTVICALLNGKIIGWYSKMLEKHFEFTDALPFKKYFE